MAVAPVYFSPEECVALAAAARARITSLALDDEPDLKEAVALQMALDKLRAYAEQLKVAVEQPPAAVIYNFLLAETEALVEEQAAQLARQDWPRVPAEQKLRMVDTHYASTFALHRAVQLLGVIEQDKGAGLTNDLEQFRAVFRRGYTRAFEQARGKR